MKCPNCGTKLKVGPDHRDVFHKFMEMQIIYRSRFCPNMACDTKVSTYEVMKEDMDRLFVHKTRIQEQLDEARREDKAVIKGLRLKMNRISKLAKKLVLESE